MGGVGTASGAASVSARPVSSPTITGGGSTYSSIAIGQWVSQVGALYGDTVDYEQSSSIVGLNEFAAGQVNFAASEIGYSSGQANQEPPGSPGTTYQYVPAVAGATCLMYNVKSTTDHQVTSLNLDPEVMGLIFTGQVTKWNAPQIAAINPGIPLPRSPITVVYRSDAAGENYIFSQYLDTEDPSDWNGYTSAVRSPAGAQAVWPIPQGGGKPIRRYDTSGWIAQAGANAASNYVGSTPGTITYVETGYALEHNKPCASILNDAGNYVQPSERADAVALQNDAFQRDLEQYLPPVFASRQPHAYPLSAYSYLVTPEHQVGPHIGKVLGAFIRFAVCQGQQAAGRLGYSPIPPNLVQDAFIAIDHINGATRAPATPTAANCANPTITGTQLKGIGGAVLSGGGA